MDVGDHRLQTVGWNVGFVSWESHPGLGNDFRGCCSFLVCLFLDVFGMQSEKRFNMIPILGRMFLMLCGSWLREAREKQTEGKIACLPGLVSFG